MSRIPKFFCISLSIIFIIIGILQFDQPDFELWISIYLIAAAISLAVAFNKLSKSVLIAASIAYLVGAIAQWPPRYEGFFNNSLLAEQARESAGLFFCFLATAYYVFLVIKKRSKKSTNPPTSSHPPQHT
jgi:branched-subunit amino acid ABC-type transport system permease component